MRMSLSSLNAGVVNPNILGFIKAVALNSQRAALDAANVPAITNNSGGTVTNSVAVPTVDVRAVPAGANLQNRTAFNTAITEIHDGIANLRDTLNLAFTALGLSGELGDHDGAAGVANTVAAISVGGAAVDGSAGNALLRSEANAAISRQRNNLATLIKAYNTLATSMGMATIPNNSGGKANGDLTFNAIVTANTAVAAGNVATSDLASSAAAAASLTALRNNVAHVANKINTVLNDATLLAAREPILLVP